VAEYLTSFQAVPESRRRKVIYQSGYRDAKFAASVLWAHSKALRAHLEDFPAPQDSISNYQFKELSHLAT
jgi:hypothetical protein